MAIPGLGDGAFAYDTAAMLVVVGTGGK